MEIVEVPIAGHGYVARVGQDLLSDCGRHARDSSGGGTSCALVTDSNVSPLYGGVVRESLEQAGVRVVECVVPAGESTKSMETVSHVCNWMIEAGLDRSSFLVALGGGVVGDLGGFVAAVFYRGIPFVQIPTTVLAQVDSSVGGKTGVNAPGGKNLIGAFHHPRLVIADTGTLKSLPPREFAEGMAEVVKHGVIRDAALVREAAALAVSNPERLMARNIAIKAAIVCEDPEERSGVRALLNFGHTVGHAIEQASGYGRYLHGEAISMGLAAALHLSCKHAGLSREEQELVLGVLRDLHLPVVIPPGLTWDVLRESLVKDKKFEQGQVRFVLTSRLGTAFVARDVRLEDIRSAVEACR